MKFEVTNGDCLEWLKTLEDSSVDSIVTDPPAGVSFMGKDWDKDKGGRDGWIAWMTEVMSECFRVLKPGAHGLVWALPRTSHWTAMACENAGFYILDSVHHVFGTGFPKSLNISKEIDRMAGAKRTVTGIKQENAHDIRNGQGREYGSGMYAGEKTPRLTIYETADATDEAKKWHGFGTSAKPSHECWWLIRKPVEAKNIASQVLETGTGAINIDGCRVGVKKVGGGKQTLPKRWRAADKILHGFRPNSVDGEVEITSEEKTGRWPTNFLMSHSLECTDDGCVEGCPIDEIGRQSGEGVSKKAPRGGSSPNPMSWGDKRSDGFAVAGHKDSCTAARFFPCFHYHPKPSTTEKNAGLDSLEPVRRVFNGQSDESTEFEEGSVEDKFTTTPARNSHPTVKGIPLMRWLVRLVTPPGGTVMDPFTGSGTTGCAAVLELVNFIGCEQDERHHKEAVTRIEWWSKQECYDVGIEKAKNANKEVWNEGQTFLFEK